MRMPGVSDTRPSNDVSLPARIFISEDLPARGGG
jgi:hypothetical protein